LDVSEKERISAISLMLFIGMQNVTFGFKQNARRNHFAGISSGLFHANGVQVLGRGIQ
jgi:hypothetical protein